MRLPCFRREAIPPEKRISGPALIIEPHQTVVVEAGWSAEITRARRSRCCKRLEPQGTPGRERTRDPVLLEVFANRFMGIAEQMGEALRNTAQSVNIKERLDFCCALFDGRGPARRQRAACARASRQHGPLGRDGDAGEGRQHAPRRRVHAQRALQRRHASPRHYRRQPGVRRRRRQCAVLCREPRPPRGHRRYRAGLHEPARALD